MIVQTTVRRMGDMARDVLLDEVLDGKVDEMLLDRDANLGALLRLRRHFPKAAVKLTHQKHYQFCIGGGAFDTDGLWKPTKDGLGYARVLDYIEVRY